MKTIVLEPIEVIFLEPIEVIEVILWKSFFMLKTVFWNPFDIQEMWTIAHCPVTNANCNIST